MKPIGLFSLSGFDGLATMSESRYASPSVGLISAWAPAEAGSAARAMRAATRVRFTVIGFRILVIRQGAGTVQHETTTGARRCGGPYLAADESRARHVDLALPVNAERPLRAARGRVGARHAHDELRARAQKLVLQVAHAQRVALQSERPAPAAARAPDRDLRTPRRRPHELAVLLLPRHDELADPGPAARDVPAHEVQTHAERLRLLLVRREMEVQRHGAARGLAGATDLNRVPMARPHLHRHLLLVRR